MTLSKILIANRGEIACRIIRTANRMGIKCVSVFSDADSDSLHVKLANEAIYIGKSQPQQSYLVKEKILEAAKKTNCQAVNCPSIFSLLLYKSQIILIFFFQKLRFIQAMVFCQKVLNLVDNVLIII